jgi:capsular exopolysaccharide synthesis family protein
MKSAVYASLLQKREESELAYASTVSNNRIVDDAQAGPYPVSPKKVLVYLVALVLFVGSCIAVITIRESLTGKILYRNEIEARTSIPIIGEVAFDKSKKPIVIESGRRSFIAEEFRTLRISLSSVGIDDTNKKILITSSISGEGKSFIATNLAISLGLTGKKVVLVDMDLNNPSIAKMLQIESQEGVTEFLTGKKEASEIVQTVTEHENLFFVPAGELPNNPTELLSKGRVKELIHYLDGEFDIVVIDTSPMAVVTDGYLLTGLCNSTLYVVRHSYTPKMMIKRLKVRNNVNPIHNPAIIFNGVKMRGFFKVKYGYGYGYDYVYRGNYGGGKTKKEKKTIMKS